MAIVRVTQRLMVERTLNNINVQLSELMKLQEQLATGKKVNVPTDDPLATRRAISAQSAIGQYEQFMTNISSTTPFMRETETAILAVEDLRQRAYELALQGGNSTNGQQQRDAIAEEINAIIEEVLVQSNQTSGGRNLFGGTRTLNTPFIETRDANGDITSVAFEGNNEKLRIEISENVFVTINVFGSDVFNATNPGTEDIFDTLIQIREDLRAGNVAAITPDLDRIISAQDQLLQATAHIGAVTNRIARTEENLLDAQLQEREVLSDNVDADFAEVVMNLEAQSNAYQAALNAGSRVIKPSLLDYL